MVNSAVNSPNSTFETEDTIKVNSSIISSSSASNNHHNSILNHSFNDQFYQYDTSLVNAPFNPLPPPPISINQQSTFHNQNQQLSSTATSNSNSNFNSSYSGSSSQTQEIIGSNNLAANTSDYFHANDYSLPNSSHYSIFSNQQAMNSTTSLHNDSQNQSQQIFKLNMDSTSDILNDYSISNSQSTDLMYNLTEFELGNPSLESIPDSMLNHSHHYPSSGLSQSLTNAHSTHPFNEAEYNLPHYNSTHDITQYPYTPTISDAYTPTLSEDSSYTPTSSHNTISNNADSSTTDEFSIRAPVPLSLKSSSYSSSSPNLGSHKVTKKPSIARMNSNSTLNNKKSLVISTQISNSSHNTPLSESSPQMLGISPLCNKYKGLDIYHQPSPISARSVSNASNCSSGSATSVNTPSKSMMPPLNIFRHNSDSSASSSFYETPRRKTYPNFNDAQVPKNRKQAMRKTSKSALIIDCADSTSSGGESKPKKYTRRRLLPRSKNGCWICRIKHLKCDEKRPVCTSCVKFGIDCDYSPEKPAYVTDKNLRKEKLLSITLVRKQKQVGGKKFKLEEDEESLTSTIQTGH